MFNVIQFMAHPNCQQHLTSIWFGREMGFMQSLAIWKKMIIWVAAIPLLPIFSIIYIASPDCKVTVTLGHVTYSRL